MQGCGLLPYGDPRNDRIAYRSQGHVWDAKVEADIPTIPCSKTTCSSSVVNPLLYQRSFENERLAFTGTYTNTLTGQTYNTYEKDPPPPTGNYQNLASERHLERLQGFGGFWQSKLGHAEKREPPPFQDVEYPEARYLNVAGGINDQRSELRDLANRDISLNMNSFRPDGQTTGYWGRAERPAGYTGYVKTRRDVPFMPATMRGGNGAGAELSQGGPGFSNEAAMARPRLEPTANKTRLNPHHGAVGGTVAAPQVVGYEPHRPLRDRGQTNTHPGPAAAGTGPAVVDLAERGASMKASLLRERRDRVGGPAHGSAAGWRVVDGVKRGPSPRRRARTSAARPGAARPPCTRTTPSTSGRASARTPWRRT